MENVPESRDSQAIHVQERRGHADMHVEAYNRYTPPRLVGRVVNLHSWEATALLR